MSKKKTPPCKLKELIMEYLNAARALKNMPPPPSIPERKVAYTLKDWGKYKSDKDMLPLKLAKHKEARVGAEKRLAKAYNAITMHIPTVHKWFITDDGFYAVALQKCDWPGAAYRIRYRENPKVELLPELSTIIIP